MQVKAFGDLDRLFHSTVRSYKEILDFFAARTGGKNTPRLAIVPACLGNQKLFATFSAIAEPGGLTQWNPITQRPPLILTASLDERTPSWDRPKQLQDLVHSFIMNTHEMIHVLIWEPFFTGCMRVGGPSEFQRFSLQAEGFCFFHTDILMSPMIRERFPDSEFIMQRRAASTLNFNIARVFEDIGMTRHEDILRTHLDVFMGRRSRLLNKETYGARTISRAMYGFHVAAGPLLGRLYGRMRASGIFSEYWKRFLCVKGLPKLLPEPLLGLASQESGEEYFVALLNEGLEYLETLPAAVIDRVKCRRSIQSRAYYAFQLRYALSNGLLIGREAERIAPKALEGIQLYLGRLERALHRLAEGVGNRVVDGEVEEADRKYDQGVRRTLVRGDVWVSDRQQILGVGGPMKLEIGLTPARQNRLRARTARKVIRLLIARQQRALQLEKSVKEQKSIERAILDLMKLDLKIPENNQILSRRVAAEFMRRLKDCRNLKLWSAPLGSFDPYRNRFKELLFVYE